MNVLFFLTPKSEVAYLQQEWTLRQAIEKLERSGYTAIPMIDREGRYVGTVTEGDILWTLKKHYNMNLKEAETVPVASVERRLAFRPVSINATMEDLMQMAMNQNFVPVIDDKKIFIGIVTRKDIIHFCYGEYAKKNAELPMSLTTLCYLEQDGGYLMMHRVKKEKDVNRDKWIGVGGHAEVYESPEDCLLREVREETGLTLTDYRFRGIVTFALKGEETQYMCLYTADGWEGTMKEDCPEGNLEWISKDCIDQLELWEGDRVFFKLLAEEEPFFSLKLYYEEEGLKNCVLNGTVLDWKHFLGKEEKTVDISKEEA